MFTSESNSNLGQNDIVYNSNAIWVSGTGDTKLHVTKTFTFDKNYSNCTIITLSAHANNYWTHGQVKLLKNNVPVNLLQTLYQLHRIFQRA